VRLRVVVLQSAKYDLYDHFFYIGRDSRISAERLMQAAERAFEELSRMPFLGRPREVKEPRLHGLRSIGIRGFRKYLIFYIPMSDHLVIVRVLHGARDIERVLGDWIAEEQLGGQ
jgi:toxin ParE1/3/4